MENLAPIALFVYNRFEELEQTVEALKNNHLALQSELFIFSDGEKTPKDPKVLAVRDYIRTIDGFKKIEITESPVNKGLANSIISGVTKIVNQYGKIIVLEDDIVTSPHFLKFMNDALLMYENDEDVACITGYTYPIKTKTQKSFFIKGADCWSWATWKKGWDLFEENGQTLLHELKAKNLEKEFNFNNSAPYIKMLQDKIDGKNDSWAINWYASAFLKNKLCLYLSQPVAKNIGFTADATHCGPNKFFDVKISPDPVELEKIDSIEDKKMRKEFEKALHKIHKKNSLPQRAKNFFLKKIKKLKKYGFSGDYKSWEEVEKLCGGYSKTNILDKTLASTLKVKNGEAVFERDSYIFDKVQYSWPLLASLFKVAAENQNSLKVLDFGGALGSHYFQNRGFLKPVKIESWTVVEQPHYVKAGSEQVADGVLSFVESIDEVKNADVLILSSVLQYLKAPYEWLDKFIEKGIKYIIIDRTALSLEGRDRLTLQKVPPEIYEASYPAWFLDEKKLLSKFEEKYSLIRDFNVTIDSADGIPSTYKGYFFVRK